MPAATSSTAAAGNSCPRTTRVGRRSLTGPAPPSNGTMSLTSGTRLGPYEILDLIGAGGMGEVYRARDTRLDRIVALKVSKSEFSERSEREARAVAALNHPNICTLHDV